MNQERKRRTVGGTYMELIEVQKQLAMRVNRDREVSIRMLRQLAETATLIEGLAPSIDNVKLQVVRDTALAFAGELQAKFAQEQERLVPTVGPPPPKAVQPDLVRKGG